MEVCGGYNYDYKNKVVSLTSVLYLCLNLHLVFCSSPTNPGLLPSLSIAVDGVTSTEAFIKLSTNNVSLPASVTLSRNNKQINSFTLITTDTTIVDNNLNPNQSYTYSAQLIDANNQKTVSGSVQAQTMDTTSHNFTWQTFTFGGQGGSSTLYDVAIINENDIWAVGEMYVYDSTGSPVLYNAVHWDGNGWAFKRVPYYYQGQPFYHPIQGVFAFSNDDIWFCGNGVIHWDGNQFNPISIPSTVWGPYQMNKIWGSSSSDLYVVGNGGNIAHYNNGFWQKINSGTTTNINDIWGIPDGKGGYNKYLATGSAMLKINTDNESTRINGGPNMIIISVWGKSNSLIYTAGNGVVLYKNNKWEKINRPEVNSIYRIRGEDVNEIYGIASPGFIIKYFNGYSWYAINTQSANRYLRIDSKDNIVAATGYRGESAIVTIIRKN